MRSQCNKSAKLLSDSNRKRLKCNCFWRSPKCWMVTIETNWLLCPDIVIFRN